MQLINSYIEVFQSFHSTLGEKVKLCGQIITFLRIWHDAVAQNPNQSTKVHFITNQCYQDVLLSAHAAVSLIAYMRDNFPELPCRLDLTGTDCVETFWSKMGQWIGNHHNYTFADLQRQITHMIRLEEIRLNPDAPAFAKPHPKQESIWNKQYRWGCLQKFSQEISVLFLMFFGNLMLMLLMSKIYAPYPYFTEARMKSIWLITLRKMRCLCSGVLESMRAKTWLGM